MMRTLATLLLSWFLLLTPMHAGAADLTFWTTEIEKDRIAVIQFLIRSFMTMQDDVSVELVSVNENDLFKRMAEAKQAGETPHLVGAGNQLLIALTQAGCLDQKAATRVIQGMGVERFYPGSLEMVAASGGKSWCGIPFHGWVQGIWYRADWFREAGLAPPEDWDSLLAAAEHFHDPNSGRYGILVGTAEDNYTNQIFTQVARSNGVKMLTPEGDVLFGSKATEETLAFYAELAKLGPKGENSWRARDYFLQGKLAMMFYSTFLMDDLALRRVAQDSLTGDHFDDLDGAEFDPNLVQNVGMTSILKNRRGAGYGSINGFGIKSNLSEQEEQAVGRFLEFLFEPSHYVMWLHMAPGGMLPILKNVGTSDRYLFDPSGIFRRYGRTKIESIIKGLSAIDTFGHVDGQCIPESALVYADGVIPRMVRRTVFDDVPAEKSVAQAVREIEAIVKSQRSSDAVTQ